MDHRDGDDRGRGDGFPHDDRRDLARGDDADARRVPRGECGREERDFRDDCARPQNPAALRTSRRAAMPPWIGGNEICPPNAKAFCPLFSPSCQEFTALDNECVLRLDAPAAAEQVPLNGLRTKTDSSVQAQSRSGRSSLSQHRKTGSNEVSRKSNFRATMLEVAGLGPGCIPCLSFPCGRRLPPGTAHPRLQDHKDSRAITRRRSPRDPSRADPAPHRADAPSKR